MKLSVIVCTHNRAYAIRPCLDSIAASLSAAAPLEAEIVVVDNASKDDTSGVVSRWAESSRFPLRLVLEPKKGLASARNCGLRAAQGELLALIDDDCRLSETFVRDALRHDEGDTEPVLRGGRVELGDPSDLPITIRTSRDPARWNRRMGSARRQSMGNCIVGCNMTLRRTVAARIGPFDERFSSDVISCGEDTDYVFRAYLAGITIEYVPDMVIFHHHGRKLPAEGEDLLRNYMIGRGAVYAKHFLRDPNLCRPAFLHFWLALKEIVLGRNNYNPDVEFRKLAACYITGGALYYKVLLQKSIRGSGTQSAS